MRTEAGNAVQKRVPIGDPSRVAQSRRVAADLARAVGLDDAGGARLLLAATEMATNLVKHAREGELLFRAIESDAGGAVELLSIDRGPGIEDVQACMRDGYSTAGSPGTGLGAIRRAVDELDVYSQPGAGTVMVARLHAQGARQPNSLAGPGLVCQPVTGEDECGDAWSFFHTDEHTRVLLADGIGHGPLAAQAARVAVETFLQMPHAPLLEVLQAAHAALRSTRGAAVSVAEMDVRNGALRYAGVGNVAGAVLHSTGSRHLVSYPGTLGRELRRVRELSIPWGASDLLVMHSDGLASRWDLGAYPGLRVHDPALIAGALYRDFARGRDDVTVLAARAGGES